VGIAAVITWFTGILAGLYMLTVWLIEKAEIPGHGAPSKLPAPVIVTHLLLALTGLVVWVAYLVTDRQLLAWVTFALLAVIALLGATMFARWIPVYREPVPVTSTAPTPGQPAMTGQAEGSFPVAVVAAHGLLATATITLVLLTALGVGGT
jgi:hypothetical protein